MPELEGSMFKTVERHGITLEQHENVLDDHALQIRIQSEQIKQLQDNSMRLENIVMSESRETRLTVTTTIQQLHEVINGLMGFKSGQNQLTHSLRMARWESIAKIVGILAGSGGILYYIFGP